MPLSRSRPNCIEIIIIIIEELIKMTPSQLKTVTGALYNTSEIQNRCLQR